MKKLSNNISLVALILGAIMILYSLSYITIGSTATVIGVFGLLFGIAYIFGAILTILNVSNPAVELTKAGIYIAAFPLFIFVFYLCIVIQASDMLTITNWILIILLLVTSLSAAAFGIIALINKSSAIKKISNLAVLGFIGLLVIILVFPVGDAAQVLGGLSLVDVFFILGYFLVTKPFTELPTLSKKDTSKEEVNEQPAEEETPVEEKPAEE